MEFLFHKSSWGISYRIHFIKLCLINNVSKWWWKFIHYSSLWPFKETIVYFLKLDYLFLGCFIRDIFLKNDKIVTLTFGTKKLYMYNNTKLSTTVSYSHWCILLFLKVNKVQMEFLFLKSSWGISYRIYFIKLCLINLM
jgi:hypothetical protein